MSFQGQVPVPVGCHGATQCTAWSGALPYILLSHGTDRHKHLQQEHKLTPGDWLSHQQVDQIQIDEAFVLSQSSF